MSNGHKQHQIDVHRCVGDNIAECVKGFGDTVSGALVSFSAGKLCSFTRLVSLVV